MKRTAIFSIIICLLAACNRPKCKSNNPVFNTHGPEEDEYKAELVKQLNKADRSKVHFYIDRYTERGGKPYMAIYIQGDDICARGMLDIKNPNKLVEFKNEKGLSWGGAELSGLQYTIDSSDGGYNFIFEEVEKIID